LLINHGHQVLYGTLQDIQTQFASQDVLVTSLSPLPETIVGVKDIRQVNGRDLLVLAEETQPNQVLKQLINQGIEITAFEIAIPPLNEIFIQVVKKQAEEQDA
jgi:ABC-2 type transport system ATP-binding protein